MREEFSVTFIVDVDSFPTINIMQDTEGNLFGGIYCGQRGLMSKAEMAVETR